MAVTEVKELKYRHTLQSALPNTRSATRVWQVIATPGTSIVEINNATGIAFKGDPHPDDPGMFCKSKSTSSGDQSCQRWEVTATYDNSFEASHPDAAIENPVERRTRFIPSYVAVQEIVDKTVEKIPRAIVNSSGQLFSDPVYETKYYRRLTFIRNERDLPSLEKFVGKINEKKWLGYEPGSIKLTTADPSEPIYEGQYVYYAVTYVFDERPNWKDKHGKTVPGWHRAILDQGTMRLRNTGDGVMEPEPIKVGNPPVFVTQPVNLDGHGQQAWPPETQEFLVFPTAGFADFNKLNLRMG